MFTRSEDDCQPQVKHDLGFGARVIHIKAGPEVPVRPRKLLPTSMSLLKGFIDFAEMEGARYDLIHSHYWLSGLVAEQLRANWQEKIRVTAADYSDVPHLGPYEKSD